VVLDFDFARSVAADQVSEGTLLLLGLLTVISVDADRSMTVMLDDLDRALHPRAQRQLVEHLHELLAKRPGLQIIATSHSPYLVEHLAYEEVLAMTQAPDDGRSVIAPLADHPDAARWREEMSAGEFWSTVGEGWLIEGRAPS
jgi:predicted ATPase